MNIKTLPVGQLETNCYVVINEETLECVVIDPGDEICEAGLKFKVIATPGHTPGGVSLICENALFVGDTLFRGSCGRTDLPGGDTETELRSLKKLCELPGDYEVYPGHMDSSTLERERRFNHYCREAMANY